MSLILIFLNFFLFISYLFMGIYEEHPSYFILSIIWFACGILNTLAYIKERR